MTRAAVRLSSFLLSGGQHCVLLAAGLLVPRGARREWLNEWRGELWQAQKSCRGIGFRGVKKTTAFCLGALQDAACLRSLSSSRSFSGPSFSARRGSRSLCLLGLVCLLCVAAGGCFLSPGARVAFERLPGRIDGLSLISRQGDFGAFQPAIPLWEYREWTASGDRLLQGFAFYAPARTSVQLHGRSFRTFRLGYASENLAQVLGLTLPRLRATASHAPVVVLSAEAWKSLAKGRRLVPGQAIFLGRTGGRCSPVSRPTTCGAFRGSWTVSSSKVGRCRLKERLTRGGLSCHAPARVLFKMVRTEDRICRFKETPAPRFLNAYLWRSAGGTRSSFFYLPS